MTVTYHTETHHSKCSECLLLALRHATKQSCHWSIDWSMKLCWLLTISIRCHFSSWTYEVPRSCCHTSVKLLVILYFPVHHTWTRAPSCCDKTADFTPDLWPPNRPDLNPVDYRIWTVIQECIYQKQQVSSYIADKLLLLTKWHKLIIFHKVGYKHRVGEVGNYVAVLLQIYFSICVPKIIKIQCGSTKLLQKYGCSFLPHSVYRKDNVRWHDTLIYWRIENRMSDIILSVVIKLRDCSRSQVATYTK